MHDHHEHARAAGSPEEAEALLRFTLKHNRSHEDELHSLAHTLDALGFSDAAREVEYSLDDARNATEHIERAIAAVEAGKS